MFDIIVIGSGSGLEVSSEGAERGLSVAVVEEGPFGGTCLNRGCVPSKMLIHCADVMETIQGAERFGIKAQVEAVDWQFIIRRAYDEIDADAQAIEEGNRQAPNITVYKDRARFVGQKAVEVNGEQIRAETVVIAAGTRPWVPEIPGLSDVPYITSDEALRLPNQPKRLTIVGGGYIAAEMAHFFGLLGTEVTIVHRRPLLLRGEDEQVARRFTQVYQRKFNLLLDAQVTRAYRQDSAITLEVITDGGTVEVSSDALLLATGRIPNTDLLQVANTEVEVDQQGFIKTNEYLETSAQGIWALGDIVGKYLLKHSANLEAAYVAQNIFNAKNQVAVDYHGMPHAIFASPQVASGGTYGAGGEGAQYSLHRRHLRLREHRLRILHRGPGWLRQSAGPSGDRRNPGVPHHRYRRLHSHPGSGQRYAFPLDHRRDHPIYLCPSGLA